MHIKSDIEHHKVIPFLVLALSLIWSLLFVFFGDGGMRDIYYWIQRAPLWRDHFMECGFLIIEKSLFRLLGDFVLVDRVAAWLITIISTCLPFFFVLRKEERNYMYLALGIFLLGYCTGMQFSPDTMTTVLFVLIATVWYKYNETGSVGYLLIMAIFCAFSVVCRFPNILVIPFVSVTLAMGRKGCRASSIILHVSFYLITSAVMLVVLYSCMGFGVHDALESFATNQSGSHTIAGMIGNYYRYCILLLGYLGYIFLYLFASKVFEFETLSERSKWLVSSILVLFVCVVYTLSVGFHKHNNWQMHPFLSMMTFAVGFICSMCCLKSGDMKRPVWIFFVMLIGFIATAGSDTVYFKMFPTMTCFLPLFCCWLKPHEYLHKYNCPSLAVLFLCIGATYVGNPIGGTPIWECNVKSSCAKFKGVRISHDKELQLSQFMRYYADSHGSENVAVGFLSDQFRYANGMKLKWKEDFESALDDKYAEKIKSKISESRPTIFVCQNKVEDCIGFVSGLKSMGYEMDKIADDMYVFKHVGF